MQYSYNVGEVYGCSACGMRVEITVTASPVQELMCCGEIMALTDSPPSDLQREGDRSQGLEEEYKEGQTYLCPVCGLECKILFSGNPSQPLCCCGVPLV